MGGDRSSIVIHSGHDVFLDVLLIVRDEKSVPDINADEINLDDIIIEHQVHRILFVRKNHLLR